MKLVQSRLIKSNRSKISFQPGIILKMTTVIAHSFWHWVLETQCGFYTSSAPPGRLNTFQMLSHTSRWPLFSQCGLGSRQQGFDASSSSSPARRPEQVTRSRPYFLICKMGQGGLFGGWSPASEGQSPPEQWVGSHRARWPSRSVRSPTLETAHP